MYLLYILFIYRYKGSDRLNILIDNKSGAPIYDQIYSQIKSQIIDGQKCLVIPMKEDEHATINGVNTTV